MAEGEKESDSANEVIKSCSVLVGLDYLSQSAGLLHVGVSDPVLQQQQVVAWGECVRMRHVLIRSLLRWPGAFSLNDVGLEYFHGLLGCYQLILILGRSCTDATLHLCFMPAVIKKSFRTKADGNAKHSSHFWKPLGTHTLPCGKLHAESGCV